MIPNRLSFLGAAAVLVSGCCASPVVAPGGPGVFARYLPVDPGTPGTPADARSGEVAQGDLHWPPSVVSADCTSGRDEVADLEKAFGKLGSQACPSFQAVTVPAVATQSDPPRDPPPRPLPHPLGHNQFCFAQGNALIVVEFTQHEGLCRHVVGVAVYPKGGW